MKGGDRMVVEYDYKNPFRQCRISNADIVTNFYLFNGRCGISISMILVKEGEL